MIPLYLISYIPRGSYYDVSRYLKGECGRMINVASTLSLTGLIKGYRHISGIFVFKEIKYVDY